MTKKHVKLPDKRVKELKKDGKTIRIIYIKTRKVTNGN